MANPWSIPAIGWTLVVAGWWFSPVISFFLPKLFAYLVFDAPKELRKLEVHIVPDLKAALRDVEEKRMMGAARDDCSRSDLETLDKLDIDLKSALYQAEDILHLVDYHRIEEEVVGVGDGSSCVELLLQTAGVYSVALCRGSWGLLHAAGTCVACWTGSMIQRSMDDIAPTPVLQFVESLKQKLGQLFGGQWRSGALLPVSGATTTVGVQRLRGWCSHLVANITSCCRSWSTDQIAAARYYRDWSNQQVGFKSNQQKDGNVPITERIRLRKQLKGIEEILTSSKKSRPLNQNSSNSSTLNDVDKENSSSCAIKNSAEGSSSTQKEIDDLYRNIEQEVFGREEDRKNISRILRDGPDADAASSSTSKPYSVIGIYGITGSGKTTLARYVCEHEKDAGHFNPIMFIRVGKAFSLADIFRDMLKEIKQSRSSSDNDLESLKTELRENLKDKRFLLVLDDVWVNDDNQKERDVLLDMLSAAQSGSRILVTAQKADAAQALGAQKLFSIPHLKEEVYLSLFMHHARPDANASDDDGEYKRVGSKIANRLHQSPIAAVTVGKQLQNKSISFWETTSNLDVLNKTMGALWWSYQQLGVDIRRCFAYCSIFPKGYGIKRDKLVRIWIAQGFVNSRSNAKEELEDVGHRYLDELVAFSFVQAGRNFSFKNTEIFTVHDLLHELAERVSASEFFRVGLNDPPKDISPGVRHLFIETNNVAKILEKNLDFENLRSLFIKEAYAMSLDRTKRGLRSKKRMERDHELEKSLSCLFLRLRKLRVLIIKRNSSARELFVPVSIDRMKHLCYLGIKFRYNCLSDLILPETFSKLYHIQIIDITSPYLKSCPDDMANLIYLRRISVPLRCPNIGRFKSLQTLEEFSVEEKQGYGLNQLMWLNELEGSLRIKGLGIVRSKEEALQARLANKERLRILKLVFDGPRSDPHVQAEVLEGLCPPKGLQELRILDYDGSRYPSWMLSRCYPDTQKQLLHTLELCHCSQLESIPEGSQLFSGLRQLFLVGCDWESLPQNMERLESLQSLGLFFCHKMELLPTLPLQSLKKIDIVCCEVLSQTCREEGHTNWYKVQHIPEIGIDLKKYKGTVLCTSDNPAEMHVAPGDTSISDGS